MTRSTIGLAVLIVCATAFAAELKSGLQVGDPVPSYAIQPVCGPDKGKLCSVR